MALLSTLLAVVPPSLRAEAATAAVGVSTTSYAASSSVAGDPVTYVARTNVSGAPVTSKIIVTHTTPVGVLPLAAYASGFTCAAPSGRTITCTSTGSSFAVSSTSPDITIVAIATTTITATTIRSSSTTTATATGATSGSDTAMGTGTLPAAPTGVTVSPTGGSTAGGNTVTVAGTNTVAATAVEIGTTGELAAGTPVTLLTCASGDTTSCFVVSGTSLLVYMPTRSSNATVSITVVTRGVAGAADYVYASRPSIPATPTATAGITSAVVTWVAPAANGGPITGYTLTSYLNGTAQAPVSVTGTTTTRTLTGLTAGGSYTFTVAAVNAIGTSNASNKSAAVVPYDLASAPTVGNVVAADLAATLSWTAPSDDGGSAITGYVVTPFIGTTAQRAQTFASTATSQSITGLTAGTAYTFTVAARNAAGTGPESASSAAVTPNPQPTLTFTAPPDGRIGLAYSNQLTVTGGTSPFAWTVSSGSLPDGLSLAASTGLLSGTPTTAGTFTSTIKVTDASAQTATRSVTITITGVPAAPAAPTATAGSSSATVTWVAPATSGAAITGYVVTPYLAGTAQTPVSFDASATTRTLTGLTVGGSYRFTVAAINTYGTGTASAQSTAVVPYTSAGAPTIGTATAGDNAVNLTWTAPTSNGSSTVTGYVVTPYLGSTAQSPQTFASTATTQDISGLTAGTAYTFTVAAVNAAGTGAPSARSTAATPNASPTLTFAAPPAGEVSAPYSQQLTVNDGTSPFTWSISSGTLPAGLTLGSTTGLLSGTPTAAGSSTFTVRVLDASGQAATRSVTLVVAAAPSLTFSPAAGEVTVPYSQQPTLTGGTGPFVWTVAAGSLPAGVSINSTTGLVSGTPTAAGTSSMTVRVTDSFGVVASRTVSIAIATTPTLTSTPPTGQAGEAYSYTFVAGGGTAPFTYSVVAGTLPSGFTLTSAGVLSAATPTVGSTPFSVRVVDAYGVSATRAVTLVIGAAPVSVVKTANVSSAAPGDTVRFTTTVTNASTTRTYTGVQILDPLADLADDAVVNDDATVTVGSVTRSAAGLQWDLTIAPGATATLTYTVTVANPGTGNKLLTGTVATSGLSTNCDPGAQTASCTAAVTVSALSIVHNAGVATTTPGSTVTFSIVVTNNGQTPYPGARLTESLAGMLDDTTYNGNASATSGSVSYTSPTLSWTGNLAVGASATITYSVTVANPDTGNRSLTGTVVSPTAGSTCPSDNPGASCSATVTVLVPSLVISNRASTTSTTPGGTVGYTVTFTNTGQTAYTGTSVKVALADAFDDATYGNNFVVSSGSIAFDPGAGTATWTGDIPVGAVVTITNSLTVKNPDPGNKLVTTVASSTAPGSNCPAGSSNTACTSTVQVLVPALTIAKSSGVSSTTPGSVVAFSVLVTNTGQTPYTGASFSDSIAGVLDDAGYNDDVAATTGTATYGVSGVSWSGDLAVGASATVTYSVTVSDPDDGDRSLTGRVTSTTQGNNCTSASSDARCATTVPVLIPALDVAIASDVATTTPGSRVRYTATVTNSGQTTYTGARLLLDASGVFDDASTNGDSVVSTGSLAPKADGTAVWTFSLAPGQTATLSGTVTVNSPVTGDRALKASVSSPAAGSTCPAGTTKPACSFSVPVLLPGLSITKTADTAAVVTGGTVSYTITVRNSGETSYPGATFTDSLAKVLTDATYAGGAAATSGTVSYAAPTLTWTGALEPGASATITYSVTVRDPDPGDKLMSNTVVSTTAGSNCSSSSTDTRCTAVVDVLVPALTITKVADRATAVPGGRIGFTVTVTNSGTMAYSDATFTDALSATLDDAAYAADAAATSGSVSFVGSALTWTGDLAAGAKATVTYSARVNAADVGNDLVSGTVISTTKGANCVAGSTDARCSVTVPVARLVLTQVYDEDTTTPGSVVHARGTFANTGQVPYTGLKIQLHGDATDDGVSNGDQTVSSGTLVINPPEVYWTGDIPVGGTVTGSGTITINNPDNGDRVISAYLRSDAPGNNCPEGTTDTRCGDSLRVLLPGLRITKAVDTATVEPGGVVGYTVTVTNTGETDYSAATGTQAVVTDALARVLGHATYDQNATATTGALSYTGSTLSWTGDLAVGASAVVITYSVSTLSPATGDKALTNSVTSTNIGSTCPTGTSNPACRTTTTILTPALTVTKTADVSNATLGATITYTLSATNSGQTNYPVATLTDSLAGVLDDATYNPAATTGDPAYSAGTLSWSGALAVGQTKTITYTVTVNNPSTGNLQLDNTVTSTTEGSNCVAGGEDPRCRATVVITDAAALTLTKTANVVSTVDGGKVVFTVTATNAGAAALSSNFSDPLGGAGVLDDATYNGDAVVSQGAVIYTDSTLTWTGTVAAGNTVRLTYSVTVGTPASGDLLLTSTISSTSPSESNNCLPGSEDPRCTVTVPVARLTLVRRSLETSATPGSLIHIPAIYTNTGRVPYTGISVTHPRGDSADDVEPIGEDTATSGTLVRTSDAIIWRGDIAIGQTVTVDVVRRVKNPPTGNRDATATLISDAPGNNCPVATTDPRCTYRVAVVVPQLTITTAANTPYVTPGGTVRHTVTIRNSGETPYVGAVVEDNLGGALDDARYNGDAVASSGTVAFASPVLTWTGDLAIGATATVSFTATAISPPPGDKIAVNAVTSSTVGSTCAPASGSSACRTTVLVLTPALSITAKASQATAVAGDTVTFTVTATNTGQTAYTPAALTVPLGGVLDDATYQGTPQPARARSASAGRPCPGPAASHRVPRRPSRTRSAWDPRPAGTSGSPRR